MFILVNYLLKYLIIIIRLLIHLQLKLLNRIQLFRPKMCQRVRGHITNNPTKHRNTEAKFNYLNKSVILVAKHNQL